MNGQNAEIGLGGSEDGEFVAARLQGSPTVRHAELHIARQKNRPLAKVSRGDHLMCRIEKAGKTLTFAIGSWNDNKFEQSSVQKINAIGKAAPFLNKENAALFLRGTANFTAVRLIVDGKVVDPGTRPMREPTPGYAQMPLVKLGGSAPWPSWLRSVGVPILDKDGISEGVLESIMPKLVDKDFTVDVRFRTVRHDRPTLQVTIAAKEGKIGVGVGTAANRSGNGTSGLVGLRDRGGEELAKVSHPGEYVLRLRRSGDLLTAAIGKIENDALKLLGERTLLSLKQAAPFLADGDAKLRIDIGKSILVEATRLIVDGKETEPVRPAVANAAPDFNRAPLRKLDGSHPLPDWLVSEGIALLDGDGFSEGILHSTDRDLIDKDFTFDMQFRFHDRDQKIFIVGIGGKRGFIHSRVHGPGYGGYGTLALPDVAERHLTEFVTAGPHIFRIEKRGDSLTLAIGDLENGAFAAIGSRTIVDLKKSAPYFDRNNGALRIENDRTVHIDAVRLVVDGKVMGNKAVSDKVVSNKPVAPKRLTVAEKADRPETTGFESAPLLSLGDRNPLPGWLAAGGVAIMDKEGFRDGRLHSIDSSLALKDFVFDVQFRFRDRDRTILLIGVGGPAGSISSRVHGPGYGGYGTVTIPQAEERRLGDFYTAGPHLFRLEKRGDSLTMAIGDIEKGNFEPIASKTIVDLKNVAPFLSKKGNGEVWIQNDKNAAIIEAVRLIVDGKPAEAAPVAKVEPNRAPSVGAKDIAAPPTTT
ncbi:MAG TPA: hypothetical protein VHR72_00950, partial [Gemmataceae bacterium]|nr:hypothetical protein [Gemmataceae bacterium]